MRSTGKSVGECPKCGDELYIFRTSSGKRLVKCVGDPCPEKFAYGIPAAGKIENTAVICPKHEVYLLAISKNIRLARGDYKTQQSNTYLFGKEPCFACSKRSKCDVYKDVAEEYVPEKKPW